MFEAEVQFTQPDVVELTGITPATLQNWVNRGVIRLAESNPGRQAKRTYCVSDVLRIAFYVSMGKLGLSPTVSEQIFEYVESEIADAQEDGDMDFASFTHQKCVLIFPKSDAPGDYLSSSLYINKENGMFHQVNDNMEETPVDISHFDGAIFFKVTGFLSRMQEAIKRRINLRNGYAAISSNPTS